jgi:NAD(P)-dependent dehydrogenase (short-subunit alcohol dehydrogenase family)
MSNRVWLITGCSSGLGRALAEAVLERGDRVLATARRVERLGELVLRWPGQCEVAALDLQDAAQIGAVAEVLRAKFGRLDVLVNNAGVGLVGSLEAVSGEQVERNFAVNCLGPLQLTRAVLPLFRAQKSGQVVNVSAAAAISNYAGFGVYGAAKAALEGWSEALALEGRAFGLRVTLVQPGPFRTEFIGRSMERVAAELPEYAGSAGKFASFLTAMDGKQAGDPALAARAILAVVDSERPPLRLILGKYAVEKSRRGWVQREAELKQWEAVSLSADGPASAVR